MQHTDVKLSPENIFWRCADVVARVPFSRSTLLRMVKSGTFPAPVNLGAPRLVAWRAADVLHWLETAGSEVAA